MAGLLLGFFVFFKLCTVNEWEGPAVIQRRPFPPQWEFGANGRLLAVFNAGRRRAVDTSLGPRKHKSTSSAERTAGKTTRMLPMFIPRRALVRPQRCFTAKPK